MLLQSRKFNYRCKKINFYCSMSLFCKAQMISNAYPYSIFSVPICIPCFINIIGFFWSPLITIGGLENLFFCPFILINVHSSSFWAVKKFNVKHDNPENFEKDKSTPVISVLPKQALLKSAYSKLE